MSIIVKDAVIFAGGLGTRMRPLTDNVPKPLIEVNGKSIIAYILDNLVKYGIENIFVNTHYLHDKIEDFLTKWQEQNNNINLTYHYEEELLGSAGTTIHFLPQIKGDYFFAINGDILFFESEVLSDMAQEFDPINMDSMLLLEPLSKTYNFTKGDVDLHLDNKVNFSSNNKEYIVTGIQLYAKSLYQDIPYGNRSNLEIFHHYSHNMYGLINKYTWLHVGTIKELEYANNKIKNMMNNIGSE
jgi:N-acetyl-alpha-D-muramate 1-phosphate uridylyltransferase